MRFVSVWDPFSREAVQNAEEETSQQSLNPLLTCTVIRHLSVGPTFFMNRVQTRERR